MRGDPEREGSEPTAAFPLKTALLIPPHLPGLSRARLLKKYETCLPPESMGTLESQGTAEPREGHVPAGNAELYFREIGKGPSILVVHGGPAYDHRYLLPEMDRLSDAFRLIYYDQRGRGLSSDRVNPEDVNLASDVADLDRVRERFGLESAILLGHSWGSQLTLEYALRHPGRVSRMILMNPSPASAGDWEQTTKELTEKLGAESNRINAVEASAEYLRGDPDAEAAFARIWFRPGVARPEDHEKIVARLKASFTAEGILKARSIGDRLWKETFSAPGYEVLSRLPTLSIPTLIIYGDHEFIPAAAVERIASALPIARMVTLTDCGHFSYLESPLAVHEEIDAFLHLK